MSKYIGKRVFYFCDGCGKAFTLNKKSIDESETTGKVYCSKVCQEQALLKLKQ